METWWSSFVNCLGRILEIRDSLKLYFELNEDNEEKKYFEGENVLMLQLLYNLTSQINIKIFEILFHKLLMYIILKYYVPQESES